MTLKIKDEIFEEERSLYGIRDSWIDSCKFMGPLDGESPLKECHNIILDNCYFELRYPLWHDNDVKIQNCELTEKCRAALWYCNNISLNDSVLHGIKAVRECENVAISNCDIISQEFGWFSNKIRVKDCKISSEYVFLKSNFIEVENLDFKGKYSFQYIKNCSFDSCNFDTKDAFWHCENVVVKNSTIKGEYLAWYANNLTFINCKIIGTQPLCYCKNLKLIDCEMIDCDLSFEKSEVEATILNEVDSIKNPLKGNIYVPSVKEIIYDDEKAKGNIFINNKIFSK